MPSEIKCHRSDTELIEDLLTILTAIFPSLVLLLLMKSMYPLTLDCRKLHYQR